MNRLKAIVTGGTRGIGKAIVEELVKRDSLKMDVAFIYNSSDEKANLLKNELQNSENSIMAIKADVCSFDQTQEAVSKILAEFGTIDVLVNNAGITRDNLLLRMSEQDFDDVISANLKSVFNFTKAVLRPMIKNRSGRIINISSVVGIVGNP
ncbi:MAG: SDR family NAD(P)-dependent oxidoreductase, partial [Melioribacteraceae bacterium]|nr:SDR family NAD(P)-dependent oxidoreductase [Melioribacteraceae bacterium]